MKGQNLTDCPMDSSFGQFSLWQAGQTSQKKAGDDDEMRGDGGEVTLVKLWPTGHPPSSPSSLTEGKQSKSCTLYTRKETPVSFEGWASETF